MSLLGMGGGGEDRRGMVEFDPTRRGGGARGAVRRARSGGVERKDGFGWVAWRGLGIGDRIRPLHLVPREYAAR